MVKYRSYVFTYNMKDNAYISPEQLEQCFKGNYKYLIFQEECGEQGTHHYQGAVQFSSARSFNTIKKMIPTAHIEVAQGTWKQIIAYCSKEETRVSGPFSYGEVPNSGGNKLSEHVIEELAGNKSIGQIVRENTSMAFRVNQMIALRGALKDDIYQEYAHKQRDVEVIFINGAAGSGKTRSIYESHDIEDVYFVDDYDHPWDNYDGQSIIVLDDFRGQITAGSMLRVLDRYPYQLGCRYKNKYACWNRIYITSNLEWCNIYKEIYEETRRALNRRVHYFITFEADGMVHYINNPTTLDGSGSIPHEFGEAIDLNYFKK